MGRPKEPVKSISNWARWKRAQRADKKPKNKGMIRHHTDGNYGKDSPRTVYMSRALHNRLHKKKK